MGFKLIVFDFDGTLADTSALIWSTMNRALAENGFPAVSHKKLRPLVGLTLEQMLSIIAKAASERQVAKIAADYREIYLEAPKSARLYPGVRETLENLKAEGKILAIATSKSQKGLNAMLDALELHAFFSAVATQDMVARKKPSGDMVQKILSETGMRAEDALVVGDTVYDVEMGKDAGAKTCAVTYGAQDEKMLLQAKPDFVISRIGDLRGIV